MTDKWLHDAEIRKRNDEVVRLYGPHALSGEMYEAYLQGCAAGRSEVAVPSYQRGFAEGYEHGMTILNQEKRAMLRRAWLFVAFCLFMMMIALVWR